MKTIWKGKEGTTEKGLDRKSENKKRTHIK
jgi:hypothetical protein